MASRTLPNLGLAGFWALGEDNYKDEMDLNLLKLSVLTQGGVASKLAAVPGSPSDGDVHLLDETAGGDANKVVVRDNGAWVYFTPAEGWLVFVRGDDEFQYFDGTAWTALGVTLPAFDSEDDVGKVLTIKEDGSGYEWADVVGGSGGGGSGGDGGTAGSFYETSTQWRIRTLAAGSDGGVKWGEFDFADADGLGIASGGTPSASSETTGHEAAKADDLSTSTYWEYNSGEETAVGSWWQQTFDSPQAVRGLYARPATGEEASAPLGFIVEYYYGGEWKSVGSFETTWPDNQYQIFQLSATEFLAVVEEAPEDGKEYVRKDGEWIEATGGEGTLPSIAEGDAGKAVTVNDAEDGYELSGAPLEAANNLSDLASVTTAQTNLKLVVLADQAAYDALDPPDADTFYFVPEEEE